MLAKRLGGVHRIELEISDEERARLLEIPDLPPEITELLHALFPADLPPEPPCFGRKTELDMRTEPCATQCALSKECAIRAATGPVDNPAD